MYGFGIELKKKNPMPLKSRLDLDCRFFPRGIQPGELIELRGPESSGKTFTLTYFLARFLFINQTHSAIFIDTTHQFNVGNLISILSHLDSNISSIDSKSCKYVKRLHYISILNETDVEVLIKPNSSEGGHESELEKILLSNSDISAIFIDTIDSLWRRTLQTQLQTTQLEHLLKSTRSTLTPILYTRCSTVQMGINNDGCDACTQSLSFVPQVPKLFSAEILSQVNEFVRKRDEEERNGVLNSNERNEYIAYLGFGGSRRSKQGAIGNHRVRFSIFSGMLWIVEDEK